MKHINQDICAELLKALENLAAAYRLNGTNAEHFVYTEAVRIIKKAKGSAE